ncbi:Cse1-domain-containing protein [Dothidotthia symphoricarpi CBS 119687]|uniref:Cse1-domain-containing protein n=1 Tax=Dothidotthia symphoricarpi CBS 119687 TaxID=1392245 RepID=A0A6A6AD92_9PLEO|nr:Cse1-domain-containing protein [Dothidotthia symphoricarpi CBS 119687]KAF2128898.1 Cse1-domain-containing protein [Dothidotthia symphoricarpi CBS 119687]
MAADIPTLSKLLEASLDPRQNKQAEKAITEEQTKPNFSLSLLHIVASDSFPATIRLSSALYFKNFVKRNWVDEDGNYKLPQDEVVAIKRELIGLMVSVPANLQAQLGEAISAIADSDFWERWDTLVDDLISRLTPDNSTVNNGVLRVAHSIFKRWRPLFRSDELFTEINHVLTKFSAPFLTLLQNTDALITSSQGNPQVLKEAFTTLDLLIKLFYDLSCQDLPPDFEDHIGAISGLLHKYLVYDNPSLHTDDETESGPLEYVRAGIFEGLMLYIQKYEDVFGAQLPQFIESTWGFLMSVGLETKYDILVSKALQFLTAVASTSHAESFNNQDVLVQIIEKVILPNLTLRESDVELFEDEPIEFIRRDLEGSDNDTRRRAATNFLRQLMSRFESLVTRTSQNYIEIYLQDYAKDTKKNWKSKDTAVYLFTAIAAKGTATAAQGVLSVNENVDILDFFQKHIAADLQAHDAELILKVDAIKYLYVFRSQLSPDLWRAAFPLLVNHLGNDNYVIHTYAAIAVERVLFMTDSNRQPIIPKSDVVGASRDLLTHLFKLITKDSAPEKIQENEFLMKCIMRVLIFIRDGSLPIAETVLNNFVAIIKVIRHNPSNPRFQYYLFEGLGALIRFGAPNYPQVFETKLYEPFATCLSEGIDEFSPYIFQLFSALLEANPSGDLTQYRDLLGVIIQGSVWEQRGNVPALSRLLSAMIARDASHIVASKQLEPVLGIFQKLVATKAHEGYAFELIEAVVTYTPIEALQPYFVTILQLMLQRLSSMKTENFQQRFIAFYHFVSARQDKGLGADFFINVTDQIQRDVFKPIYLTVILPETQKLARPTDRKTAVVSFTKTLADSQAFVDRYPKGWALTAQRLLELMINPPVPAAADDIIPDADVDELGFGVGFTQLNTCKKAPRDPFPEITDVKEWIKHYLRDANSRHNGRIVQIVQQRLDQQLQHALAEYL